MSILAFIAQCLPCFSLLKSSFASESEKFIRSLTGESDTPKPPPREPVEDEEPPHYFSLPPPSGRSMQCMGFYPTQPMWVGERTVPLPAWLQGTPQLAGIMHERVKGYAHDHRYVLMFTRDGMVMIALAQTLLDSEGIPPARASASSGEVEFGRKWSLYVDYLNAVNLLLAAALESVLPEPAQLIGEVTLTSAVVFQHYYQDPLLCSVPHLCAFAWHADTGTVVRHKHSELGCQPMHLNRSDCFLLPAKQFGLLDWVDQRLWSCDTTRVRLLAMVARAIHAYQERSYDTCLILLWTVIESSITSRCAELHERTTPARIPPVKQTRRARKSAQQQQSEQPLHCQSIAVQIRTLHQLNLLPSHCPPSRTRCGGAPPGRFKGYIENVRYARNDFVHRAKACRMEHCNKAYAVLVDLVREDWSIKLPFMVPRAMINLAR